MDIGDCYVGWATDDDIRTRGASGGLVTAMLAAALEKGLVEAVVVLKKLGEFEAVPVVTSDPEEVKAASGSMHSVPIVLSRYLEYGTKVALPAKPCDARSTIEQAKRGQVDIDTTYIVGLNCGGTMHPAVTREMLDVMYKLDPNDIEGEEIDKGKLIFETKDGEEHAIKIDELEEEGYGRRESCQYCAVNIPTMADIACGNWGVIGDLAGKGTFVEINTEKGIAILQNAIDAGAVEVTEADEKGKAIRAKVDGAMMKVAAAANEKYLSPIEGSHLDYYMNALSDCINCGACKTVCPVCACGEGAKCTDFSSASDTYKMSLFHLVRFVHLMDSCIGCGQCTDVCPVDIPLTHIYQRFAVPMQEEFEYKPGMDMTTPPFFGVDLLEEGH